MLKTSKLIISISALLLTSCTTAKPLPTESSSTPPPETAEVQLYYVSEVAMEFVLFPETHEIAVVDDDLAKSAVAALVSGSVPALDPDYTNLWAGSESGVLSLTRTGNQAVLDLKYGHLNVGSATEMSAIMQAIWTITTADPSIESVKFLVEGKPVESLAGHVDTTGYISSGDAFAVLSDVTISEPLEGAVVSNPVVFKGMACTFEANVAWQLLQKGEVIKSGSTLAAEACPVRSAWSVTLPTLEPGTYTFRARDYSAKDGSLIAEDSKKFVIE